MKRIYLIGFMGTGKTTVAHMLGQALDWPVWDLDAMIEQEAGQQISQIFAQYGEPQFRHLETLELQKTSFALPLIISCGGGAVLAEENRTFMKENGHVVLLTASAQCIYERLQGDETRPLLGKTKEEIENLLNQRAEAYLSAAHTMVNTEGKTAKEICDEILEYLGECDENL